MKMTPVVRWLSVTSFVLVLCASASAAQSTSHSHKPRRTFAQISSVAPHAQYSPEASCYGNHANVASGSSLPAAAAGQLGGRCEFVGFEIRFEVIRLFFSSIFEEKQIEWQKVAPLSP